MSKYENNKQEPMMSVVHNLSILLNVSADYLLGSSHTPTPQGENGEFIFTIQQAVRKATPKQREKMLQLMKLSFEDLFEND